MPDRPQAARGHEEPFAIQFSLFLANRVGQLNVLATLAEEDLDVLGVSVVDSTDWAVIRLILSDANRARSVLHAHHLPFTESRVILAPLPGDESLIEICSLLLNAELSVHFAYPLTVRYEGSPMMVLHVDDTVLATHLLSRHGFRLLGEEDLTDPV